MSAMNVAVVGAGVMGAAAAWQLAQRGHSVTVVEQFADGHTRGSSHGDSRIFRLGYPDPLFVRLARDARLVWQELEDQAGVSLIAATGSVDHGDPASVASVLAALDAEGVGTELLTPETAHDRWPGMKFSGTVVFQPGGGRIASGAARMAMIEQAQRHGATFRFETPVRAVEPGDDGARVVLDGEVLDVDAVVVAAGAWVGPLLGGLIDLPPVRVTQENVLHFAARDGEVWWPSFIHHGSRFVYGLETPGEGIKVAEHHTGPEVDADTRNGLVDGWDRHRLSAYAEEWLPGVDPTPVTETTCLYTTTPTEDFVLDRVGPVVVASPCSGHGFKFAPLVGRVVADLVDGEVGPERFRLPG